MEYGNHAMLLLDSMFTVNGQLFLASMQKYELGGVQVHLLDGVCAPHVGPCSGLCLCCASCLLRCQRLHQLVPGQEPGTVLPHGRHPGTCWLVDGQERLAGLPTSLPLSSHAFGASSTLQPGGCAVHLCCSMLEGLRTSCMLSLLPYPEQAASHALHLLLDALSRQWSGHTAVVKQAYVSLPAFACQS